MLTHVSVIDATGAALQRDRNVVIADGRIRSLGPSGRVPALAGARIVDASGKFLIPGLWDMHVHLTLAGESALPMLLANGVTSVRDAGGDFDRIRAWRHRIASGDLSGPRIKAAGNVLESASWVTRIRERVWPALKKNGIEPDAGFDNHLGIATADEARRAVETLASQGVDFIKSRTCESPETFFAIAAAAKRLGLPFVTHPPPAGVTLAEASDAGPLSLEHFGFADELDKLSEAQRQALYARFVKNQTWFDPTVVSGMAPAMDDAALSAAVNGPKHKYLSRELAASFQRDLSLRRLEAGMGGETPAQRTKSLDKEIAYLKDMHAAGVRFLAGTDLAALLVFPGFSLHDELELLVTRIGLTPMEALISATRHPAEFFKIQDSLGTVTPGKVADLVLLDANPLDDIRNVRRIRAVIVNGRLIERAALDRMLN